jgi:hypothetical protein
VKDRKNTRQLGIVHAAQRGLQTKPGPGRRSERRSRLAYRLLDLNCWKCSQMEGYQFWNPGHLPTFVTDSLSEG